MRILQYRPAEPLARRFSVCPAFIGATKAPRALRLSASNQDSVECGAQRSYLQGSRSRAGVFLKMVSGMRAQPRWPSTAFAFWRIVFAGIAIAVSPATAPAATTQGPAIEDLLTTDS